MTLNTTKFITLRGAVQDTLLTVSVKGITLIKADDEKTIVFIGGLDEFLLVKESSEQILEKISQVELHDQQR